MQIPLSEQAKEKKFFVTEETVVKFERMPFGLKGVPGTFQRLMSIVFKDLREAGVVNTYLDDIIISSSDWSDMLISLGKVFEALLGANLNVETVQMYLRCLQIGLFGISDRKG